jgi:two-component system, OmpR family, response regulator QseB
MKLLLVEDNQALSDMLTAHLHQRGFAVDPVTTGAAALASLAGQTPYDAIILDLGLPDMDGMDVLRHLRAAQSMLPALILTARDSVTHRVAGLNAGADDYILKPFNLAEFEARLRAVLRRPGSRDAATLAFGDVAFDTATRTATVQTHPLDLTRREAALFEELIRHPNQVVVRDTLTDSLYGLGEDVSPNALEATVSRVRRKLASQQAAVRIDTLRGIGYRLTTGPDPVEPPGA